MNASYTLLRSEGRFRRLAAGVLLCVGALVGGGLLVRARHVVAPTAELGALRS